MTNSFNFTAKSIANLPLPDAKGSIRTYYYDIGMRALSIYVTNKGVKTFFVYRKIDGRPQRITLGRADEITVEQAREKAQALHSLIAQGIHPQDNKRTIRQEQHLMSYGKCIWSSTLNCTVAHGAMMLRYKGCI